MKQTLVLAVAWPGPRGMMQPGSYAIPGEISRTHARCACIDGAGEIIVAEVAEPGAATFPPAPPPPPPLPKGTAPENKRRKR